ncbi:hypothetical protein XENOCAPTIV_022949, partial [Xenoophorus captivus]
EANADSTKAPEQIRIKTLEEIKQDKAAKTLSQKDAPVYVSPEVTKTDLATKVIKRSIAVTDTPTGHVKTFSEILRAKKRKQEEQQNQNPNLMKVEHLVENAPGKSQGTAEATNVEKVRVKTLEEIRREKSARLQAQQTLQAESKEGSDAENNTPKRRHLLLTKKLPTQCKKHFGSSALSSQETLGSNVMLNVANMDHNETSTIKVKTFDEIMQEKRLRKQEMEGQVKSVAEADCSQNQSARPRYQSSHQCCCCQRHLSSPAKRFLLSENYLVTSISLHKQVHFVFYFSPVLKTPIQSKPRRSSIAASRTASTSNTDASGSSVDDFEELINQFTDDHLEEDVDPAIGEDDLLQELSEMIDS